MTSFACVARIGHSYLRTFLCENRVKLCLEVGLHEPPTFTLRNMFHVMRIPHGRPNFKQGVIYSDVLWARGNSIAKDVISVTPRSLVRGATQVSSRKTVSRRCCQQRIATRNAFSTQVATWRHVALANQSSSPPSRKKNVSRLGLVVWRSAGKRKDAGSIPRFGSPFLKKKKWFMDTVSSLCPAHLTKH